MTVVDQHGRLTDETLRAFEEAIVARTELLGPFLERLDAISRPRLVPAALVAAGDAAGRDDPLTDENLPEEVPALTRPSERTR